MGRNFILAKVEVIITISLLDSFTKPSNCGGARVALVASFVS
jgi:hypothetical protein